MMWSVLRAAIVMLGVASAVALPAAAHADGEYLRITPSTIQAGFQVEIDAFCGDNVNPATVSSEAFGVVTITPQPDPRTGRITHRGTTTIPPGTPAAAYRVILKCPSQQSATTTLHVVNHRMPRHGPHTGGGGTAGNDTTAGMIGVGSAVAGAGALLFLLARRRGPA